MQTVPLRQIFQGVSALMGAELVSIGSPDFAGIIASLNTWLPIGWEYDFWPELMTTERRAYRPYWKVARRAPGGTVAYFEGDEVYDNLTGNKYYRAIEDVPLDRPTPGNDPEYWEELTTFARYVSLEPPEWPVGLTPIGGVQYVCRNDPDQNPENRGDLRFDITNLGIVPDRRAGTLVYVHFRRRVPTLSSTAYDDETAYAAGDTVFYATSDTAWGCYTALSATTGHAPTDATSWTPVELPWRLKGFLERCAYADMLTADGQGDKAAAETAKAYGFLTTAQDEVFGQQGQTATVRVSTY